MGGWVINMFMLCLKMLNNLRPGGAQARTNIVIVLCKVQSSKAFLSTFPTFLAHFTAFIGRDRELALGTMLDSFEILSTSGVVLWSKTYVPVGANVVNSLIREIFIEERAASAIDENSAQKPTYKREGYTLKWTAAKDLGLIFVV